jgi:hypothetical protein
MNDIQIPEVGDQRAGIGYTREIFVNETVIPDAPVHTRHLENDEIALPARRAD